MNASTAVAADRKASRLRTHRAIRQVHVWIGAWGALAAVIFGATGLIQNHRFALHLPQGDAEEIARIELPVPDAARNSAGSFQAWLHDAEHLHVDTVRVQPGRPVEFNGQRIPQPTHWNFQGGNARITVQGDYSVGAASVVVHRLRQSPLAVAERLHKGVGGGLAWTLLEDSFALAMVCLGVSGLLMWSRGRSARNMLCSVFGVAALVLVIVGAGAVL
jgi:hypothetical protein